MPRTMPLLPVLPEWTVPIRGCRDCHAGGLLHCEAGREAHPLFFYEGDFSSKLLLILEAPNYDDTFTWGRITVDDDKDPSGEFLRRCLREDLGLHPKDVMITNSVLCLPARAVTGKYTVTQAVRKACSRRLAMFIDQVNPAVVATLGVKALHALKLIEKHRF